MPPKDTLRTCSFVDRNTDGKEVVANLSLSLASSVAKGGPSNNVIRFDETSFPS